jgi:hypothetical protein
MCCNFEPLLLIADDENGFVTRDTLTDKQLCSVSEYRGLTA